MGFNFVSILFPAIALLFITISAFIGATNIVALSDISTNATLNTSISGRLIPIDDQIVTHLTNTSITTSIPQTNGFTIVGDSFEDKIDEIKKISTKKPIREKGVKLFRWSRERGFRFPIRPLKLKKVNVTEKAISKGRIGYASALQTRQTNLNATLAPIHKMARKVKRKRLSNTNQTSTDIFEISSSDHSPSIAFFLPKRTSKRKNSGQVIIETLKSGNKTIKRIPKLLLPKHLRPAMYSLDGFVPRPSINKITSTEAPTTEKPTRFSSRRIKIKKAKDQTNQNKPKRFGGNRLETQSNDKGDDIDVSDSRRRDIVAKRKGLLTASASVQKPSVNRITNSRRKGTPGKDYPTLNSVPKTGFDCKDLNNGVYADVEAGCQVWHICQNRHKHSFLCPNGTIFNEKNGICDWWYAYDCPTFVAEEVEKTESITFKGAKNRRS